MLNNLCFEVPSLFHTTVYCNSLLSFALEYKNLNIAVWGVYWACHTWYDSGGQRLHYVALDRILQRGIGWCKQQLRQYWIRPVKKMVQGKIIFFYSVITSLLSSCYETMFFILLLLTSYKGMQWKLLSVLHSIHPVLLYVISLKGLKWQADYTLDKTRNTYERRLIRGKIFGEISAIL